MSDSFFHTPTSNNIERFQLKLSPKAKDAFEQIGRTAQERLEGDQTKVNFYIEIKSFFNSNNLFRSKMHNVEQKLVVILCQRKKKLNDEEKNKLVFLEIKIKNLFIFISG